MIRPEGGYNGGDPVIRLSVDDQATHGLELVKAMTARAVRHLRRRRQLDVWLGIVGAALVMMAIAGVAFDDVRHRLGAIESKLEIIRLYVVDHRQVAHAYCGENSAIVVWLEGGDK